MLLSSELHFLICWQLFGMYSALVESHKIQLKLHSFHTSFVVGSSGVHFLSYTVHMHVGSYGLKPSGVHSFVLLIA